MKLPWHDHKAQVSSVGQNIKNGQDAVCLERVQILCVQVAQDTALFAVAKHGFDRDMPQLRVLRISHFPLHQS